MKTPAVLICQRVSSATNENFMFDTRILTAEEMALTVGNRKVALDAFELLQPLVEALASRLSLASAANLPKQQLAETTITTAAYICSPTQLHQATQLYLAGLKALPEVLPELMQTAPDKLASQWSKILQRQQLPESSLNNPVLSTATTAKRQR